MVTAIVEICAVFQEQLDTILKLLSLGPRHFNCNSCLETDFILHCNRGSQIALTVYTQHLFANRMLQQLSYTYVISCIVLPLKYGQNESVSLGTTFLYNYSTSYTAIHKICTFQARFVGQSHKFVIVALVPFSVTNAQILHIPLLQLIFCTKVRTG